MYNKVVVLGAGSWGMAIASLLFQNGKQVYLWEYNKEKAKELSEKRSDTDKLKNFELDEGINVSSDLEHMLDSANTAVIAVPSQSIRSVLKNNKNQLDDIDIISLSKGIENKTLLRMSEVIQDELQISPERIGVLSGPSHAEEVVQNLPTTVVAASDSSDLVNKMQELFNSSSFRVYSSDDIKGVELGGALKNVIAISCGIAEGLGMGDNTMGALITRGLAEMSRLGVAMGADIRTFSGLSGIGDLVTTCLSSHSRNKKVGLLLGKGESLENILDKMNMVAEGVATTQSVYELSIKHNIEMPITHQVYKVLFEKKDRKVAVEELMIRKLKPEIG